MVDGGDFVRDVGGLPSLCFIDPARDLVQDTKLAEVPNYPFGGEGECLGCGFDKVVGVRCRKLVTDAKDRLGINGVDEIKAHPFFRNINWAKLR